MEDLLKIYDPKNAKNLTQDQVIAMQTLSKEQVKQLANAFPNSSHGTAYLVLKDKTKPENKQAFPPSTWQNYWSLLKMGDTRHVVFAFRSTFNFKAAREQKVAPVQDLTNKEAKEKLKAVPQSAVVDGGEDLTGKAVLTGQPETGAKQTATQDPPPAPEKALNKMNVPELTAKYIEVIGEEPEAGTTKAQMIASIEAKQK